MRKARRVVRATLAVAFTVVFGAYGIAGCDSEAGEGENGEVEYQVHCEDTVEPVSVEEHEIDLGPCASECTAPEGCSISITGTVIDFKDDEFQPHLAGAIVNVDFENKFDSPDDPGDCAATAGTGGEVVIDETTCGGARVPCCHEIAIKVWTQSTPPTSKTTYDYNFMTHDKDMTGKEFVSISMLSYVLIPGILGFDPDETKGIIAGRFEDCNQRPIANATVNIVEGRHDTYDRGDDMPGAAIKYFIDEWPDREQPVTSVDGLWVCVDVPVGPVTVFLSGRKPGGEGCEVLGSSKLSSFAGSINISDVTPPSAQ